MFNSLCRELIPGVEVFSIIDESLLRITIREGRLGPRTTRRLVGYVMSAEDAGADAVLVTCSSIGPAAEAARPLVGIPVLRVDEPMADAAIRLGRRIGVLATLRSALEPTTDLVRHRAAAAGIGISLEARMVEGAFERLQSGDVNGHDSAIAQALVDMAGSADVIVLAQASMARVLAGLDQAPVPVLSSPRFGVARAAETLGVCIPGQTRSVDSFRDSSAQ
jgi:Asp/Glu/hydantoin racemase